MALYSIFADFKNYACIGFDRGEMEHVFGANPRNHIDVSRKVKSYGDAWKPVTAYFGDADGITGSVIPDVTEFQGHLFLSLAAYEILKPMIENDGEFLPIVYENGDGFIFNPLRIAEDVDGLNTVISKKSVWDELEHLAFYEDRVKNISIFKTNFDANLSITCQASVKEAIDRAGLGGVIFTADLGNRFTTAMGEVSKLS